MAGKSMDMRGLIALAAISAGAYLAYRLFGLATMATAAVSEALTNTGSKIGTGLYDLFHPGEVGETTFYTVLFLKPVGDGMRHSVPASTVDSGGVFLLGPKWGSGQATPLSMRRKWRILVDKATGGKIAEPV